MYSGDWSNNIGCSTEPFSGFMLDSMDSLFEFEHAAKSDQPASTLECQNNWNNTKNGFQLLFDDDIRPSMS